MVQQREAVTKRSSNKVNVKSLPSSAPIVLLALALTGCAGASVAPGTNAMPATSNRPLTIYVYPFAASASDVTLNQGFLQKTFRQATDSNQNQSQLDLAHQTASTLADSVVQK